MIYTTYFTKLKKLPSNVIPISICTKPPKGYKGLQYKKLAPKYSFFSKWKETHDNNYYVKHFYEEVLNKLNPIEVLTEINNLLPKDIVKCDIVLVCYEKPQDFCHRHLVADWLNKNGYKCKEWE